ncbi:hypothetical protein MP228_008697 [Amoeboaphelidium protococcarum]|nr:hypothetical protein MP228_008697 [Amoeboaphelidium protococcarum]
MYSRNILFVQVVSVWLLFCILMSNPYPVRDILPSDGAKRVDIFKREAGAGKGGSKSGASAGPKGGTAGSNAKASGATAKPAGANSKPEKSTQPRESKASISQGSPGSSKASTSGPPSKSSANSGELAAPAKSKEAVNGPKKASTPSDTKASDAAKDSERQKIRQQGSSGPTAPQAGSMSSQQQQQASMAQKASDSVQSQSRQADRGVTGQTDAAQRGAVSGAPQGGPVDGASRAAQQQQPVSDSSVSQQSTTQQGVGQQPVGQGGAPQAPSAGNPTPPSGPSQPQGVNGPSDAQGAPASLPGSDQPSAAVPQAPSVAAPQTGAQPAAPAPQAPVAAPQPGAQPATAPEEAPPAVAQQPAPAGQDVATTGQAPTAQTAADNPQGEVTGPAAMDFTQSTGAPELLMLSNTKYTMSEQGKNMPNTAEQQKLAAQAPPDSVKVEYGPYRLSQSMLNEMGYSPEDMNKMNSATPEGQKLAASAAAEALKTYGRDGFVAQQLGPATYKNFQAGTMSSEERQKFDTLKSQLTERVPPPRPEISRIVAPPSIVNQRNAETQAPQPAVGSQNFFQNANPAVKSMADNAFQMNQAGPQQAPGAAPPGQPAAGAQPSTMPAQVGPQRLNSDMLKDLGYSQQEMDKMNEQTPAGQALSNSATAHAISEFGVNGFVAAQLGPEFTNRLTNNQMTGEDRKAFNDMKAQLTQGVDMSQYQGRP